MPSELHIVLRFVHIMSAVLWVGFGAFIVLLMSPIIKQAGDSGRTFMMHFYRYSQFKVWMPAASFLATGSGLLMYAISADGHRFPWLSNTGSIVLAIGAVFGVLAFGHGMGLGRMTGRFITYVSGFGAELSDEQKTTVDAMIERLNRNGAVSLVLTAIALVAMSYARYLT